jgi:hypothetical protein
MSPGASPGKLMVTGNLVLNAASVVNIELAGTTPTTRLRLDRGGRHGHAGRHAERQPDQRLQRPGGQQLLGAAVCQLHGRVLHHQLGDPDNLTVSYTPTSVLLSGVAPVLPVEQLAIVSPLAVAIERSLLDDDLVTDLETRVAANLTAEPEDEIEVEGCR